MRVMPNLKALILLILFMATSPILSAEPNFPEKQTFAGQELALNGKGIRTKLFFKLYTAGLYLPAKNVDAKAILQGNQPMALRMEITSAMITSKTMQSAVTDGFKSATADHLPALQQRIDQLTELFKTEINKGDIYDFVYRPQNLLIIKNGKQTGVIQGADFKQAFYGIWLGDKPVQADLKKQLLGTN